MEVPPVVPSLFRRSASIVLLAALAPAGCRELDGEYRHVSDFAHGGFVADYDALADVDGQAARLWGFVDHGNLYGDAEAKRVLGDWWSGQGPDPDHWRFDVKAQAEHPVGHAFPVIVPNDAGRDALLARFAVDARARRATKVYMTGRLSTFHAPAQLLDLIGLDLRLRSSNDIRLDPIDGD